MLTWIQSTPVQFVFLCFFLAHLWVKNCQDLLQSTYNKQRFDQPLEASIWLKNFKTVNERFLNEVTTLLAARCWTFFKWILSPVP